MKYLLLICLGICACAKPQAVAPKRVSASAEQCDELYAHNLIMSLATGKDADYYSEHPAEATATLDKQYRECGMTKKFYSYCLGHMTKWQVECSLNARSFVEENLCQ